MLCGSLDGRGVWGTMKTCMGFPGGASGKNLPANAGDKRDVGLIPGPGGSLGGGMQPTPVSLPAKSHMNIYD